MAIRGFLSRQSEAAQAGDAMRCDRVRCHLAEVVAQALEQCVCGGDRNLLLQHDVDQRGKTGTASPHRRHAEAPEKLSEIWIPAGEGTRPGSERGMRERAGRLGDSWHGGLRAQRPLSRTLK